MAFHQHSTDADILFASQHHSNEPTKDHQKCPEIGNAGEHHFGLVPNRFTRRTIQELLREFERPGLHFALDRYDKFGLHIPLDLQPLGVQIPLGVHIPLGWGIHIPISLHVPLTIHAPRGVHLLLGLHIPFWELPFSLHIPLGFEMSLDFLGMGFGQKERHGHAGKPSAGKE
ncbi:hypothetical protein BJ508DRAFT_329666 [Ascobolus immersus RN42]|uniref:Uncharacterized protein n=1 Tax=Ascobolus immersus RN42 TaxID=1160509 RepID=A0A3N4HWH9_ASCIM|nr:hypothetical protein BJ508DRAFT_329666 [Ascobolus immersus RN42]